MNGSKKIKPKLGRLSNEEYRECFMQMFGHLRRMSDEEYEQLQKNGRVDPKERKRKDGE